MNRPYILFHLKEALEELTRTASELEQDPEYSEAEYYVAMSHLYHHLNTAWNARDSDQDETDELFKKWRQFPKDIDLS